MKRLHLVLLFWLIGGVSAAADAQDSGSDAEIRELRQQIEAMQQQLAAMQARLSEIQNDPASESDAEPAPDPELDPRSGYGDLAVSEEEREAGENLETVESEDDAAPPTPAALDRRISSLQTIADDYLSAVKFGGALRLNYAWRDFDEENKERVGDFELELFRVNADGEVGNVKISAEWRRYNDFQAIHHGWMGYRLNDQLETRVGITQVPFGILPFASHSFWFGGTYYLGFEDDYDTGLQFIHEPNDDWTFHYAFYKNPEYANDDRFARYSFDLVTEGDQQNSEINQLNFRGERRLPVGDLGTLDLGISLQGGQIFNRITQRKGERYALAGHANADLGPWNLQLQGIRYEFDPENPAGVDDNFVQKGAFEFPFLMAAKANVYTANVARSFSTSLGPITGGTCYNDFTFIDPKVDNSSDSIQNVTGCSFVAGGIVA